MFKYLKSELISPENHISKNFSSEADFLKLRFNDNQRKILKNSIITIISRPDGTLYTPKYTSFIRLSDSIIKPVLDHIHNELSKCDKNQKSIYNFNNDLKSYLNTNEINEETISKLPITVIIKCDNDS